MDYLVFFIVFLHHDIVYPGKSRPWRIALPAFFAENPENGLFFQNPGV